MNQSSQGDNSPNIDNVGRDVNHLSQEGEFVGIENNEIQGAGYVEKVKGSIHNARDTIVNETHIHQYYSQPLESKPIAACPNNLPLSGVRNFIGRDRELKKLHSTLKQSQSMAIAVVSGMGGIGKTELAWQYASNYGEEVKKITWGDRLWNFLRRLAGLVGWKWRKVSKAFYRGGICWVSVRDSDVDVGLGIVNFARVHLGLHPPEDLPLRDRVGYCWQHWPIPGEVLVIFDDLAEVQQIESFLPNHHRFKVIITTRTTLRGGIFNPLVLEGLKTDKTLDLLSSLAGSARIEADRDTARSICRMLGDLPLAIELVGQYIKEEPDVTLTELRGELAHNALNQEALKKNENIKITAKRGVKAALELSWKVLSKEAQELAMQLSIFALAPIPWEWVQQCYADTASVTLRSWRGKLIGQSLLKFEGDGYELHPLVREFFAEKRETWEENEEQIEQFCRVAAAKIKSLSDLPTQSQVQSFEKIFPHMEIAAEQYQDAFADDDLIPSFAGIARYCKVQRLYDEAESWFERCLLVARNHFGEKHRHVTTCLHNLADFYNNRGRYKEAEILFLQVLEWREKNLGEEHPDVILSRNGLAILYYNQGRYKEAEILFLQVLEQREKRFGEEHIDITISLNNLAIIYNVLGNYEKAESLYLKDLELSKRLLGEEHPMIATSLDSLASLYYNLGKYNKAKPLRLQALKLRKDFFGEEHPDVATSLHNLAELYRKLGQYEEAELLFLQSLELGKKLFGERNIGVCNCIDNLANLYFDLAKYSTAEPLYLEALELRKNLFEEEHPDIATSLHNLASLYYVMGRYEKVESLYLQALEMRKKILGKGHPIVANTLINLSVFYLKKRRYNEAEPLCLQALQILNEYFSEDHHQIQKTLDILKIIHNIK